MSFFNGPHLQVISTVTSNGLMPVLGHDGRPKTKTTLLPLSARKAIERENLKLPEMLQKKIIRVGDSVYVPKEAPVEFKPEPAPAEFKQPEPDGNVKQPSEEKPVKLK
jgi:hypothetical protein